MKKTSLFLATATAIGALTAAIPLLAHAQDDQQPQDAPQNPPVMMQQAPGQGPQDQQDPNGQGGMMRPGNLENNRDFRNAMMRRAQQGGEGQGEGRPEGQPGFGGDASSTRPRPMMRLEDRRQDGQGIENEGGNSSTSPEQDREGDRFGMMPAWLAGSSTAPFGRHMDAEAMQRIMSEARRFATTSDEGQGDIEKSRGQRHAELGVFAAMQSHLLSNLQNSLGHLKDARAKIADRVSQAEQSGRDMTEATSLLATADAKIAAADAAIQSLAALAPTVAGSTSTVNASTTVSLTQPRQVGAAAIKALNDARKALNDVVVAIAHAMGYQIGEDGRIVPPPTATTTPETESTTTATTTASTTQQ